MRWCLFILLSLLIPLYKQAAPMGLIIVLLFSLLTARRYAAEINLFAYKKRPDRGVSVCRTSGNQNLTGSYVSSDYLIGFVCNIFSPLL